MEYFGDLDRAGIQIWRAVAEAAAECGAPVVRPAAGWYEVLVGRTGIVEPLPDDTSAAAVSTEDAARFTGQFGEASRAGVQQLLLAGFRLPQELVGWECLVETLG